jgi:S1 RNA binding domain protein
MSVTVKEFSLMLPENKRVEIILRGIEVGMILEGKVSGITKFGAFVDLPDSKTGMVHISEVAPTFINEISDYVKVGQEVKVKVLSLNDGKISLSMKQL